MNSRALLRNPVAKHRYEILASTSGTYINTSAWVVIVSSIAAAADAFEILNTTGCVLKIAIGATGSEVEIPYYVMPSAEPHIVPYNIAKGVKISAKAVDANANTDSQLVLNFFG